jgi:signal peptidase I
MLEAHKIEQKISPFPTWKNMSLGTKFLLIIITIILSIMLFVYEIFYVPTGSMKDSLLVGDYLVATKFDYGYSGSSLWGTPDLFSHRIFFKEPERGDIIIFHLPHLENKKYVSRVIGFPGDKIQLKKGIVYINDVAVERKYIGTFSEGWKTYNRYLETLPSGKQYYVLDLYDNTIGPEHSKYDNTTAYYVPEGKYFFLGDNRDEASDSRVYMGPVDAKNFVAKVRMIFCSFPEILWRHDLYGWAQFKHIWTYILSGNSDRFYRYVDELDEDRKRAEAERKKRERGR